MTTDRRSLRVLARRTTAPLLAAAVTGVASMPAAAAAPSPAGGGALADLTPAVTSVRCAKGCVGGTAMAGSTLRLKGSFLGEVVAVAFTGARAKGDEVTAEPAKVTASKVLVAVPSGAVSGPVVAFDREGASSAPSAPVAIVTPRRKGRGGPIATAVTTRKAYFDGTRKPTLAYELGTSRAAEVSVEIVRASDGVTVRTFDEGVVEPGEQRTVAWNGRVRGRVAPDGRYAFVVVASDEGSGLRASSARAGQGAPAGDAFTLLGHRFPIRGRHAFGTGTAAFGGGRGHQGEDVFAACGTPLVAARGGVVKMRKWQGRAGNYLVIDGAGTDVDYAYMHLQAPALVEQRERVHTGQLIGYVGDTGDADGCHLHFEEWSGPGWYTGGAPFDPLADLRAWDAVS